MVWEQNGSKRPLGLTQGTRRALEIRSERDGNERGAGYPSRPASTARASCTSAMSAQSVNKA
jgi:hypothetical protein